MSKRYRYKHILRLLATGALAGVCSPAGASGLQLMEQNVTNLGAAYAGTASLAMDVSTGFYNAAGLTRICKEQIALSLVGVRPSSKVDVTRATDSNGTNMTNVPGSTRVRGDALVPGVHYAYRYCDKLAFGLNITSPFGLKTNYDINSIVRYASTRSDLRTYDIAPSVAYCLRDGFSIGAGPDFVHADLQLDSVSNLALPDRSTEVRLSRWGIGGHVGLLFEASDCTRIGLNYRSQVRLKTRGEYNDFSTTTPIHTNASAKATLPDTAVLSAFHQFNDCWAVMADAQWTHWSILKDLTVTTGSNLTITENYNFKDTYRLALGSSYQWDDCWLFRAGLAYDRSPVRDDNRNTRVPDSHRTWVAVGSRYNFTKYLALDVGYAHLFLKKANINNTGPLINGARGGAINGTYSHRHADMLGVQLTWDLA